MSGLSKDETLNNQHCPHPPGLPTDVSETGRPAMAHEKVPDISVYGTLRTSDHRAENSAAPRGALTSGPSLGEGELVGLVCLYLRGTLHSMDKKEEWLPRKAGFSHSTQCPNYTQDCHFH